MIPLIVDTEGELDVGDGEETESGESGGRSARRAADSAEDCVAWDESVEDEEDVDGRTVEGVTIVDVVAKSEGLG